jgi:DNA-binding transcriptional MerR regulator
MFNIGTVSRMTNIVEATLRVWERRYGFPKASRTSSGRRLYSQEEVLRLQWVKTQVDEGIQVSTAIRALRTAEEAGTFIPIPAGTSMHLRQHAAGTSLDTMQGQLYQALVKRELDDVALILVEAQVLYPLEEIILEMIVPVLQRIGEAWERGEADVATEHLATNYLRYYLLAWMQVGPPPLATHPVILACAPGELHEGGLLMLGVLLRRLRWPVRYLGQAVPLLHLSSFIEALTPPVVTFVATTEESARALSEWPTWLSKVAESNSPLICFGGRAFVEHPELIEAVQGRYLGNTLQEGIQKLNSILHQLNPFLPA